MADITSEVGKERVRGGALIVNADDWGRDAYTTDQTVECHRAGALSSVSAMVFMADSERAAALALHEGIDAGLHLNLTTPFSGKAVNPRQLEHQDRTSRFLLRYRLASAMFHPGLARSFEYLVRIQIEEFVRLYGAPPARIDGHHHMHLCANVLLQRLLPRDTAVRRNFSFQPGEKSRSNRLYRQAVDRVIARRHRVTDFFFSLPPFEPTARLERIFGLGRRFVVEVETHPANPREYAFLHGGEIFRWAGDLPIATA